jgi:prepilin signal peptidase PulO-like enzyme (type II secretory pathway)
MKWFFYFIQEIKHELKFQWSFFYFIYVVTVIFAIGIDNEFLRLWMTLIILIKMSLYDIKHLEIHESDLILLLFLHFDLSIFLSMINFQVLIIIGILVYYGIQDQLGGADVQLLMISELIHPHQLEWIVLGSTLLAILYYFLFTKRKRHRFAFGPFISISIFIFFFIK